MCVFVWGKVHYKITVPSTVGILFKAKSDKIVKTYKAPSSTWKNCAKWRERERKIAEIDKRCQLRLFLHPTTICALTTAHKFPIRPIVLPSSTTILFVSTSCIFDFLFFLHSPFSVMFSFGVLVFKLRCNKTEHLYWNSYREGCSTFATFSTHIVLIDVLTSCHTSSLFLSFCAMCAVCLFCLFVTICKAHVIQSYYTRVISWHWIIIIVCF